MLIYENSHNQDMTETTNIESELSEDSDSDSRRNNCQMHNNGERFNSIIDPSYAPKILRKNKSITRAESTGSLVNESKVLVLYTGGTIGMMKGSKGGLSLICSFKISLTFVQIELLFK